MATIPRRPSRGAVARALRDLSLLWQKPPDPGQQKAAPAGTGKRLQENANAKNYTPDRSARPQRRR